MYHKLKSQKLVEQVTPTGLQKNRVAKNMDSEKNAALKKWNPYIAELKKCINNSYAFAYVFVMFAASSAPIMESTRGVPRVVFRTYRWESGSEGEAERDI